MSVLSMNGARAKVVAASVAAITAAGIGVAVADTAGSSAPPSNRITKGHGINEYGMTKSFFHGKTVNFTYTKGYYCDKHVTSHATSGCEAGKNYKRPPAKNFDPLYITVPLGFTVPMSKMECPTGLVCVDHPGTIDLTRLEPALKPLYPGLSKKQLTNALKNFATPGHDHFITTANGDKPEWWDVKVIGVTSKKTYDNVRAHKSFHYLSHQIKKGNKHLTAPIPTNLFLYFGVK